MAKISVVPASYTSDSAVSSTKSCRDIPATGIFMFLLIILILITPVTVQADGLFDFQMKLATKGNTEAQFKVGEMYETGFGTKQDIKEAEKWTRMAAEQGHEMAGFKLLYWDLERNGINKANATKVDELNTKAQNGNAQAQYYVGKLYAHGVAVKKDPDMAVDWLGKATLAGVLAAESELASVKDQQRIAQVKRREAKKQAELAARKKQLAREQQQKQLTQQNAQAEKMAKERAKERARENAREKAIADEAARRKAAEAAAAKKAAEKKRREARKQAALKKRKAKQKADLQFEADPCSGKSARFLSTCR